MLRIQNLNSQVQIPYDLQEIESRLGYLKLCADVPIYLVDEITIDEFCPPEKRKLLDPKELKRKLLNPEELTREEKRFEPDEFDTLSRIRAMMKNQPKDAKKESDKNVISGLIKEISQQIEKCRKDDPGGKYRTFYCLGLYVSYDNRGIAQRLDLNIRRYRFILLCPERIEKSANKVDIDPTLLFMKVLYHEMGHAFMDDKNLNYYDEAWCMTIEEGLANTIALERFPKWEEREQIIRFIQQEPLEYRSSLAMPIFSLFLYLHPSNVDSFSEWELAYHILLDFHRVVYHLDRSIYDKFDDHFHKKNNSFSDKPFPSPAIYYEVQKIWNEWYRENIKNDHYMPWEEFPFLFPKCLLEDVFPRSPFRPPFLGNGTTEFITTNWLFPCHGPSMLPLILEWKHFSSDVRGIDYWHFYADELLDIMDILGI